MNRRCYRSNCECPKCILSGTISLIVNQIENKDQWNELIDYVTRLRMDLILEKSKRAETQGE